MEAASMPAAPLQSHHSSSSSVPSSGIATSATGCPSPPHPPTAAAFAERVNALVSSTAPLPPSETVKSLLASLADLHEQLPLRASARLFTLLARPPLLRALVDLLSLPPSLPVPGPDARRARPYPFLVSRILSYGSHALRTNVLADTALLPCVLASLLPPPDAVTASHIVAALESFLETAPLAVIAAVTETTTPAPHPPQPSSASFPTPQPFLTALIGSAIHLPAVPVLITALLPSASSPPPPSSAPPSSHAAAAARVLADANLFPLLAAVFSRASAAAMRRRVAVSGADPRAALDDVRRLDGVSAVIAGVTERLLPFFGRDDIAAYDTTADAETADADARALAPLNIYHSHAAAAGLASMIDEGVLTLKSSNFKCTQAFYAAVDCTVLILQALVAERARRSPISPSVLAPPGAPPPPLSCPALDLVIVPRLFALVEILIDTASLPRFAACRLRTLDLFVAAQKASASPLLYAMMDRIRFSEVAFKLLRMQRKNSILHAVIASSVETALISDVATSESRAHWLGRARLVNKILLSWASDGGILNWTDPGTAQRSPYLSTIIHMACCVQHLQVMAPDSVASLVSPESLVDFAAFCAGPLTTILSEETRLLGGARPPRRRTDRHSGGGMGLCGGGGMGSSLLRTTGLPGGVGGSATASSRAACSLVRSPSAHRFGYIAPPQSSAISSAGLSNSRLGAVFESSDSAENDDLSDSDDDFAGSSMRPKGISDGSTISTSSLPPRPPSTSTQSPLDIAMGVGTDLSSDFGSKLRMSRGDSISGSLGGSLGRSLGGSSSTVGASLSQSSSRSFGDIIAADDDFDCGSSDDEEFGAMIGSVSSSPLGV